MENNSVDIMWKKYLKSIDENEEDTNLSYTSWYFGGDKQIADELAELTIKGDKRATTSLHYLYEIEKEEVPKVGELSIITDFDGNAKCIIKTTDVKVLPFSKVDEKFAYTEGEGYKSLEYWRRVHIKAFNDELKELSIDMEFSEDMLVVCEIFQVIYK